MSKHIPLTATELAAFAPTPHTVAFIEAYCQRNGLQPHETRIIDWGCGRGRTVLWLRERGYAAWGVDVDKNAVTHGSPLAKTLGHDNVLIQIAADNATPFPDNFFHISFSNEVFEHVADIDSVARELARITQGNGAGLHIFPAHHKIVEGHLFMPLVHWLPKNRLRWWAIWLNLKLDNSPDWDEVRGATVRKQTDRYFRYSVHNTFYRTPRSIRRAFNSVGFVVQFVAGDNPRFAFLRRWTTLPAVGKLVNWLLTRYKSAELMLTQPPKVPH